MKTPTKKSSCTKVEISLPAELIKWASDIGYSPELTAEAILQWFINPLRK